MGTNFYLRKNVSEQHKALMQECIQSEDWESLINMIPESIHIGKRSGGWKFLWNANKFKYFKPSKESLIEFLKSGTILNEYGRKYTFEDFWNNEYLDEDGAYDLKSYYNENFRKTHYNVEPSEIEFFNKLGTHPNKYGEFYIDDLRFTVWDDFR